MAASIISSVLKSQTYNSGTSVAIDTTGATFILVICTLYRATGVGASMSDSQGNGWTNHLYNSTADNRHVGWFCNAPAVGAGHTFTVNGGPGANMAFIAIAVGGTDATSLSLTSALSESASSLALPSISAGAGDILIATAGYSQNITTAPTVPSGYTMERADIISQFSAAAACKIMSAPGDESPVWTFPYTGQVHASLFKVSAIPASDPFAPDSRHRSFASHLAQ